jgi:hypothetical protein
MNFYDYHFDSAYYRKQSIRLSAKMLQLINCIEAIQIEIEITRVRATTSECQELTLEKLHEEFCKLANHCKDLFFEFNTVKVGIDWPEERKFFA